MPCDHTIQVWYKDNLRVCQYGRFHGWQEEQGAAIIEFLKNNGSGDKTNIDALKQALDADMTYHWVYAKEHMSSGATSLVSEEVKADYDQEVSRISDEALTICPPDDMINLDANDLAKFLVPYKILEAQSQPGLLIEPSLSRACGAGILGLIANTTQKIPLNMESVWSVFGPSILWHYVIDLEASAFEIYYGIEDFKHSDPKGRFDDYVEGAVRPRLVRQYTFEQLAEVDANILR